MKFSGVFIVVALIIAAVSAWPVEENHLEGSLKDCGIEAVVSIFKCLSGEHEESSSTSDKSGCASFSAESSERANFIDCLKTVGEEFMNCLMGDDYDYTMAGDSLMKLNQNIKNIVS